MDLGKMELWVAMDGDIMAAAFYLIYPGLDPCNYGYILNYSQEKLGRVVNMDTVAVRSEYRGQGLHFRLMEAAEAELLVKGTWIALCTIHPDNCFSLANALKRGYTIQKKIAKYGSVRYVLRKDIL